jgi:hypothetical protein
MTTCSVPLVAIAWAAVCSSTTGEGAAVEACSTGALLPTGGVLVDARNFELAASVCTSKVQKQKTRTAMPFPNIITRELSL